MRNIVKQNFNYFIINKENKKMEMYKNNMSHLLVNRRKLF